MTLENKETLNNIVEEMFKEDTSVTEETKDEQTEKKEPIENQTPSEEQKPDEKTVLEQKVKELEVYRERYQNLEKAFGKQGNELGKLRKDRQEMIEKLNKLNSVSESESIEKFNENPTAESQRIIKQEIEKQRLSETLQKIDNELFIRENTATILNTIPDFEQKKNEIIEVLKEDKIPQDVIDAFARNPYAESPVMLVQLAKRADDRKRLREMENSLGQYKTKGDRILDNVTKATNGGLDGKPGGKSGGTSSYNEKDFRNMTSEQLAKVQRDLIDQILKKGE